MKPAFLLVVASSLLLASCSGKKKSEIEGSWAAVSAEKDPKLTRGPSKDQFAHSRFTFSGDQFTMEHENRKAEGTVKVDPSRAPKEIDLVGNQTIKGIYKLEGPELTICFTSGQDPTRPSDFSAKPGSRAVVIVMKRE
jgi:uncharacterized protein (TIGR03067 family)